MGRKPNPVVLQFFDRGDKLSDSSNRYQHTCKRCGQLFPKGRIDTLLNHILRYCHNATTRDRQLILLHINEQSSSNLDIAKLHRSLNPPELLDTAAPVSDRDLFTWPPHDEAIHYDARSISPFKPDIQSTQSYTLDLPSNTANLAREQSALDTLAEVSRHHLNYPPRDDPNISDVEGRLHATLMQHDASHGRSGPEIHSTVVNSTPIFDPTIVSSEYDVGPADAGELAGTGPADMNLVQAASAASEQLQERSQADNHVRGGEQDANVGAIAQQQTGQTFPMDLSTTEMSWSPTNMAGAASSDLSVPRQSGQSGNVGFGILADRKKGRSSRGRFAEDRRKEVHEVRKRGACIRCRMLKKPCSEGTPCTTCKNVESARLWKSSCLRSRVAEEFTLWSLGLFHHKARQEVPAAVHRLQGNVMPGRLEILLIQNSDRCMSFLARRYCGAPATRVSRSIDPGLGTDGNVSPHDILLIDEGEGMVEKLETYIGALRQDFAKQEMDPFLSNTLSYAIKIEAEKSDPAVDSTKVNHRSCYSIQNMLLRYVIELCVETSLLMYFRNADLVIHYEPDREPSHQIDTFTGGLQSAQTTGELLSSGEDAKSRELIKTQILAVIEARCAKLGKLVMNELERRLLQRQQVSSFATFISAVLLLSSVEMMCQIFHESDNLQDWSTESSPQQLAQQGEHFCDLVVMLMRMRALPPGTRTNTSGNLEVHKECLFANDVPRAGNHAAQERFITAASDWLDPIGLSVEDLRRKKERQDDWHMRLVSRLLLPE
ncbi:hypothetical protein K431DRAFT_152335 [Polychaeton citri CBS 116435]|uniref:Uncharacterized protein n=1 Tax=Polychaeton citri CBS 116435 TaxID=1314669 RepID=A0A9P4UM27_9PEZI|nr:hypothetical protein K431DRAFT_152335 [Polychaeton citri CBS 116435]